MTTRKFFQQGQAYGPNTGVITAKIDGNIVFQGPVTTLNEPLPQLPQLDLEIKNVLFSWTNDVFFAGSQTMEITVENAVLLLTNSAANFAPTVANGVPTGNETTFSSYYFETTPEGGSSDPLTNESINGVIQMEPDHTDPLTGQWWWRIPPGGTFSATVNIQAGNIAP